MRQIWMVGVVAGCVAGDPEAGDSGAPRAPGGPRALARILSTASATSTAASSPGQYGESIALMGDNDGDGYLELAVGAPGSGWYSAPPGDVESLKVVGHSFFWSPPWTLSGPSSAAQYGASIAAVGDVNADGYIDLAVASRGSAWLYPGTSSGVSSTATVSTHGHTAMPGSTVKVAHLGDVNGDGIDDFGAAAASSWGTTSGVAGGIVEVFFGGTGGPSATADVELEGPVHGEAFGCGLAGPGDVNGDGYDDVLVGICERATSTHSEAGAVALFYGSATGPETTAAWELEGAQSSLYLGLSLSPAGDVNGDGYDDLLVGSPRQTGATGYAHAGAAMLFLGGPTGPAATPDWTISGTTGHEFLGLAIAAAGDVNGDGYDDVAVGGYGHNPGGASSAGRVQLFLGSAAGLAATADQTLLGTRAGHGLGYALAAAGDVNGDGFDDIVVASQNLSTIGSGGELALHLGYADQDGDGYIVGGEGDEANQDCDDTDPSVGGATTAYADHDGDGYGDPATSVTSCSTTSGYVDNADDCDDDDASIHPKATEVCDADDVDEDCDGAADNDDPSVDPTTQQTFYVDIDGDGHGDPAGPKLLCDATAEVSSTATDCDDSDATVRPDGTEVCDPLGVDEDCDGLVNDDDPSMDPTGITTWFQDDDGDGHGDAAVFLDACAQPPGMVADKDDCDDGAAHVHPGAPELCDDDDVDEDCDGLVDDADPSVDPDSLLTWWYDGDGDGYGQSVHPRPSCAAPVDGVLLSGDCDDLDPDVSPAAVEICDDDDVDEDCDGLVDDADAVDLSSAPTWFVDDDGDGYGDPSQPTVVACDPGGGLSAEGTDCDDTDPAVHPGAVERCDESNLDEDCDGLVDDADSSVDPETQQLLYRDADGDGFGDPAAPVRACDLQPGLGTDASDCDDSDPTVSPAEPERPGDGVDQDCDGSDAAEAGSETGETALEADGAKGCATAGGAGSLALAALGVLGLRRRREAPAPR